MLRFSSSVLVTAIHFRCLEQAFLSQNSAGLVYLDRLLLSLIFHCSKDDDHARAINGIENALNRTFSSGR